MAGGVPSRTTACGDDGLRGKWLGSTGVLRLEADLKITILGGAGFLGRKIAAHLAQGGSLGGRKVTDLTLFDIAAPLPPARD